MGDSVEFRDGVFVATGTTPADGVERYPAAATGTALMVRPDGHLAPIESPGPLVNADLPPAGPAGPEPASAPGAGGARRIAVATIVASVIAAMAFGAAAFGGAFGGGGTPSSGSARGALGAAAATSASATSVAFTVSATRSTSSGSTTFVDGTGAVDLAHGMGTLSATVPALSGLVGSGNDSVQVITDGSTVYVGSAALSSLAGGATWLKVSLPHGASSPDADSSTLAVLANPSKLLGLLSSIGGQVTTVGNVDLHGTPTTEYSTTVSVADLASRAGLTGGSKLGAQVSDVLRQLGNTTIPVKAWVGNDGFVRQISASLDLSRMTVGGLAGDLVNGVRNGTVHSGTSSQATTATTVTVGFSQYNAPVTVTVPPASQTTDVNAIAHSVQSVFSGIGHAVSSFAARF
jgi:hypothetical protein